MIHWAWALAALFVGSFVTLILVGLFDVSKREDERPKKWWEE